MSSGLKSWLDSALSDVLGFPSTDELSSYILAMESADSQRKYLAEILDPTDEKQAELIRDFNRKINLNNDDDDDGDKIPAPQNFTAYKKKDLNEKPSNPNSKQQKKNPKFIPIEEAEKKQRNLDSNNKGGKGRKCDCQAVKHDLVNNCTNCGKIVCALEGSGSCSFCGSLVVTKEEAEILSRGSIKSEKLLKKLAKAEEHKRTLLEYDASCEKRTKVIDDESDYFSVDNDKWLTKGQRERLRKKEEALRENRHGSRLNKKLTFDFAGRRVIEDTEDVYDPSRDNEVMNILNEKTVSNGDNLVNPYLNIPRPKFLENDLDIKVPSKTAGDIEVIEGDNKRIRIQDKQLQELNDPGLCLSMHQPFASMLVAGIKRHEGRTWYSSVRGRLWIHAASRQASEQEIEDLKRFYVNYYGDKSIAFPNSYPTSCLLGSVDVEDCLAQEDYSESHPDGESSSPYVFVCKNPLELLVKFPMSGQHKIYKLDPNVHQAAKKAMKTGLKEQ